MSKADYVRAEAAADTSSNHECHWPGCTRKVPPAMWGCRSHWFRLPAARRSRIWRSYRPGQEKTKTPSAAYVEAAREVQKWIAENSNG